jgi:hypothetical protein
VLEGVEVEAVSLFPNQRAYGRRDRQPLGSAMDQGAGLWGDT